MLKSHLKTTWILVVFSLTVLLISPAEAWWIFGGKQKAGSVTILHTNDSHAQIQGCGCRHAGGGLIKRAYKVKNIRDSLSEIAILDAGNILFGDGISDMSFGRFMVDALNLMQYNAINITPYEFKYGTDTLLNLQKLAKFPFISANVCDKNTSKPLFQPYTILTVAGLKIGVIGISHPSTLTAIPEAANYITILPIGDVLPGLVKKIRNDVDILVVLSYSGWENDRSLASDFTGIDLILGGYTNGRAYDKVKETLIGQAFRDGKYLGLVSITKSDQDTIPLESSGALVSMEKDDMDDESMRELIANYRKK